MEYRIIPSFFDIQKVVEEWSNFLKEKENKMYNREDLYFAVDNIEKAFKEAMKISDLINQEFELTIYRDGYGSEKLLEFEYSPSLGTSKDEIIKALETNEWASWSEAKRKDALLLLHEISDRAQEYWDSSSAHC